MRASAPSANSTATALLPTAEGNAVGASSPAAAERSRTGSSADRGFERSPGETPDQPFAAALAGAQAGNAHENASKAEKSAATAGNSGDADEKAAAADKATASAEALIKPRISAAIAAAMRDDLDGNPASLIAADSALATEPAHQAPSDKISDTGGATRNAGAGAKSKGVKHSASISPTAASLDGGALAATALLLNASSAQFSARVTQTSVPLAPHAKGEVASVRSTTAAAASPATSSRPSRAEAADVASLTNPSSNSVDAPDRALVAIDPRDHSADSSLAGGAPDATAQGASLGGPLAPVMQTLSAVTNATVHDAPTSIRVAVSDPHWPQALAAQVQWMAGRQVQSATLRLSPEHLGPLEVRIDVMHSQINVNFNAHHADTRDALMQAVPRLRELFAANGLNLGEATVRQEAGSSSAPLQPQPSGAASASKTVEPVANTAIQRIGLVDEYA